MKFFVKNFKKLFNKEIQSGTLDSLGGAALGFCLALVMIGMFVQMIKPIPIANKIFAEKERSLFIPFAEKYSEPIVSRLVQNAPDSPLSNMLAMDQGDMIMPDMLKGLMEGGMIGDVLNMKKNLESVSGAGGLDEILEIAAGLPGAQDPSIPQISLKDAMKALNPDTSQAVSAKDLMKLLQKKIILP